MLSKWGKQRAEERFEKQWTIPIMVVWGIVIYSLFLIHY
jgi:hypothetical protein